MEFVFAKDTLERKLDFPTVMNLTPSEVKAIGREVLEGNGVNLN